MMSDIDQSKLDKMWKKILEYEKDDGLIASDKTSVSKIIQIIDEVYKECF